MIVRKANEDNNSLQNEETKIQISIIHRCPSAIFWIHDKPNVRQEGSRGQGAAEPLIKLTFL